MIQKRSAIHLSKRTLRGVNEDRFWRETFNIINDAITIHDTDFNIITANRAAEELLREDISILRNKKCYEAYHGCFSPPEGCPSCRVINTGEFVSTEIFEPKLNKHLEIKAFPRFSRKGKITGIVHIVRDITRQKTLEAERDQLIFDLTDALMKVKILRGLIPICASCKKIRDDRGYWKQVEEFLQENSDIDFTHGFCPECEKKAFPRHR